MRCSLLHLFCSNIIYMKHKLFFLLILFAFVACKEPQDYDCPVCGTLMEYTYTQYIYKPSHMGKVYHCPHCNEDYVEGRDF